MSAIPAMANAHSHAFQRDLRGIAERQTGAHADLGSWRTAMHACAGALDPASLREVAGRCYAQMAAAGYGVVGEFHYVHHRPDGAPYDEPNALAHAVAEAAVAAGLEIVLLPAAYARAGPQRPASAGERRFCDPSVEAFLERVEALRAWAADRPGVHVGVAAHSVRAVEASWLRAIAEYAKQHELVRHVHAAERRSELEECWAEHRCSPIELLDRTGFLGPRAAVVHAVHVSDRDISLLADRCTTVVACRTTEGSLGDGHPPLLKLADAGVPLAIGSDSQVRIDPFEEVRELETCARREGETRHALLARAGDLWGALAAQGRACLGLPAEDAAMIEVDREHPDLRGVADEDLPLALATCASAAVVIPPPTADAPLLTRATVRTERPAAYMKQVCKHFRHKRLVTWSETDGLLRLAFGTLRLSAVDDALVLVGEAPTPAALALMERVVGSHLERFGRREGLVVTWERRDAPEEAA